jgi:hypothetical protein
MEGDQPASRGCAHARASTWRRLSARPRTSHRGPISAARCRVFPFCPLRRAGAPAVDAAGDRRQDIRRRGDPQPGQRRERGRTPRGDRRPQRHGAGFERARRRRFCCHAASCRIRPSSAWWRHWSARRRRRSRPPSTTISTARTSRSQWRSTCPSPPWSTSRRTSRSTPASACRRSPSAPTPREGPRPPHVLGYVNDITAKFLAANPNAGYTQGSHCRRLGD